MDFITVRLAFKDRVWAILEASLTILVTHSLRPLFFGALKWLLCTLLPALSFGITFLVGIDLLVGWLVCGRTIFRRWTQEWFIWTIAIALIIIIADDPVVDFFTVFTVLITLFETDVSL